MSSTSSGVGALYLPCGGLQDDFNGYGDDTTFQINGDQAMQVYVFDDKGSREVLNAVTTVDLNDVFQFGRVTKNYFLFHKDLNAGVICFVEPQNGHRRRIDSADRSAPIKRDHAIRQRCHDGLDVSLTLGQFGRVCLEPGRHFIKCRHQQG